MPKIDKSTAETADRQVYPGKLRPRTKGFHKVRLSDAVGLTQFGIGEVTLQPGSATGLFHWHEREDEFVYVLEGEATVVEGEHVYTLGVGECAGWRAGEAVGHTVENRSDKPLRILELGTRDPAEIAHYPGIDMILRRDGNPFFGRRDGTPLGDDDTPDPVDEAGTYPDPEGQIR